MADEWQKLGAEQRGIGWRAWWLAFAFTFVVVAALLSVLAAAGHPQWEVLWSVVAVFIALSMVRVIARRKTR